MPLSILAIMECSSEFANLGWPALGGVCILTAKGALSMGFFEDGGVVMKALKTEPPQAGAWIALRALLLALPLLAPTAGAEAPQERAVVGGVVIVEEIIVTARKRQESLLEIPESVAAIAGAAINRENLRTLEDIGVKVPNLNLATRLDGFPNVSIRGLGSFGNTQGVGFYLDDVQVFSDASSRFGDLERIEVLTPGATNRAASTWSAFPPRPSARSPPCRPQLSFPLPVPPWRLAGRRFEFVCPSRPANPQGRNTRSFRL